MNPSIFRRFVFTSSTRSKKVRVPYIHQYEKNEFNRNVQISDELAMEYFDNNKYPRFKNYYETESFWKYKPNLRSKKDPKKIQKRSKKDPSLI